MSKLVEIMGDFLEENVKQVTYDQLFVYIGVSTP